MMMRRLRLPLLILLLSLMAAVSGLAQNGTVPHVQEIFDRYGRAKDVTTVVMRREMLTEYDIHLYRSLTMREPGKRLAVVRAAVDADRKVAKSIKEVIDFGTLSSGYYELPPANGLNRYILYRYNPKRGITLIYIEGKLGADDLVSLLLQNKNTDN